MKQQFTGSYTLDVASRTIVLSGIEIPPERLAVVINATAGFVYHNLEHDPNGEVTISGGDTILVFPRYKDCVTHRDTDALSIFYDDGVDLGQLIKDESDETQGILPSIEAELEEANATLTAFKSEATVESDETQGLLSGIQNGLQGINATIPLFQGEVKAESDETQALIDTKVPDPIADRVLFESLGKFDPQSDIDVSYLPGDYGPSRIIYSKDDVVLRAVNLYYGQPGSGDNLGKLILVTSALWTPAELTTRNAWFDASVSDSIVTDGADVTAWNDRTSNGFALVRYPSTVPAPKVGAPLFDLPTIAFDGGDGYLQSRLNGSIRSLTNLDRNTLYQQEAIFIVARTKSDYFGIWLLSVGITTGDTAHRAIVDGNDPDRLLWRKSGVYEDQIRYDRNEGWSGAANNTHLLGFIATPSTSELYDTGRLVELHDTTGTPRAGGWDRIGLETNADFAEMLILSEVPDETTRQRIEGYLAHKWGLAGDLPTGHPYKFAPPGI